MFKSILLTIDLTEPASWVHALPRAAELARGGGGELHVLTVVPDYGMPMVEGFFPPDFRETSLRQTAGELDEVLGREAPKGLRLRSHVRTGTVHVEILHAIDELKPDLVVMASHAPDRVREFLIGSQADRVVRRSPVSVLVVRG